MKKNVIIFNALDYRYSCSVRARMFARAYRMCGSMVRYMEAGHSEPVEGTYTKAHSAYVMWKELQACLFCAYDGAVFMKPLPIHIPAVCAALARGKKVILDWDDLEHGFHTGVAWAIVRVSELFFCKIPVSITTHSKMLMDWLLKQRARCAYQAPQCIPEYMFEADNQGAEEVREKYGLCGKFVCGYAASFTKGGCADFDYVLETYQSVLSYMPDAYLLVMGAGPLEPAMRLHVKRKQLTQVIFTGFIAHHHMPAHLQSCDVCVVSTRDNAVNIARVSLKILEYMASRKPIIGSICGENGARFNAFFCAIPEITCMQDMRGKISAAFEYAHTQASVAALVVCLQRVHEPG